MKLDAELFDLCREFIKENKIEHDEDELDRIDWADLHNFIHQICELIGYYEDLEEELEDEEYED